MKQITIISLLIVACWCHCCAQCNESQMKDDKTWSAWQLSGSTGLHYRVDYGYHNQLIAKDGGKAHIWNYEIKNITSNDIKFKYAATEFGGSPKYGVTTLKAGDVMYRMAFTDASCSDFIKIRIEVIDQYPNQKSNQSQSNYGSGQNSNTTSPKPNSYSNYNGYGKSGGAGSAEPNVGKGNYSGNSTSSDNYGIQYTPDNSQLQQQKNLMYQKAQQNENTMKNIDKQRQFINDLSNSISNIVVTTDNPVNKGYIPHAANECFKCSGTGKRKCSVCNGIGTKTCIWCNTTGILTCATCNGSGKYLGNTCTTCGGTIKTTCPVCNGQGNVTCATCNGSGGESCPICHGSGTK